MATKRRNSCPTCGLDIPEGSPGGLCPRCLLGEAETPTLSLDPDGGDSGRGAILPGRASKESPVPDRIGPYRILDRIGEGGMGQVYRAEQRDPVRRKVAVKIIKPGMDSREVLARFDAERQALALMDHPNVSRVLDAGLMENGRPYFVMDLVVGRPITEFCDQNHLSIEDRLELFFQVCQGVQHAHQKGVIHRDIKPSNVIVTVNNSQPIPKVIDFGIAKAMGSELTQQTYFTFAGQIIGTPHYMSPEQAESHASDIDTRSDIYSLGVMLYELLTGRTPLTREDFEGLGLEEMLRKIRETEAMRPSTVLMRLDDDTVTRISKSRGTASRRLALQLRGDLDWIVIKALEKDRTRRYETANALALDIRRYLRGEPVSASPPTVGYRVGKFVRRHKGPLFATILITFSLLAGMVVSLYQRSEALHARQEAIESAEEARRLLAVAEDARKQAFEAQRKTEAALGEAEFAKEEADAARARTEEALKQAESAKAEEERQRREAEAQATKAEVARMDAESAKEEAQRALADLRDAIEQREKGRILLSDLRNRVNTMLEFLRSQEIRRELQKKDPNGLDLVRSLDKRIQETFPDVNGGKDFLAEDFALSMLLGESSLFSLESSLTTAESNYRSALGFHESLEERGDSPGSLELARIHHALGRIASLRGRYDEAIAGYDRAEALLRGAAPSAEVDAESFELLLDRARARYRSGDSESARSALEKAERIRKEGAIDGDSSLRLAGLRAEIGETSGGDSLPEAWSHRDRKLSLEVIAAGFRAALARERDRIVAFSGKRIERERGETPVPDALTSEEKLEAERAAAEREEENEELVGPLLELVFEVRAIASESVDRRVRLLELHSERLAGEAFTALGLGDRALQHHQRCLDRAVDLLREDGEMAGPLELQFLSGCEISEIYRKSSERLYGDAIVSIFGESIESDRGQAAIEGAYRALAVLRRRGVSVDHLSRQIPDFLPRFVESSIYEFYDSMSSPSALEENAFYAEEVLYFDRLRDRSYILEGQLDYREKYPFRLFRVKEIVHLPRDEQAPGVFRALATINWWMADHRKENRVDFDRPEGELTQKIGFAFDEFDRLRIVEMKNHTDPVGN